jgi:Skp family chaperone for outer membrane proteins
MNRNLTLLTALGAGLVIAPAAFAQAAPAAEAPATASAATAPTALPAKIALINFQQVVLASNEGQVVTANTQKKFSPQKEKIQKQAEEIDSLKKSLQSAPATLSDDERASRLRTIDSKEKALNRDAEDAQTAYNTEWQEGLGKVAQKISVVMKKYAQSNGYTLLLDVSNQNSDVMWALPSEDVSQVVVDDYNKQSGVAAPAPSAPSAPAPRTTPRPAAKPAAHK